MTAPPPIIILHNTIREDASEDVLDILRQSRWIASILNDLGHRVSLVPFSLEALERIAADRGPQEPTVVNLVDSAPGEESLAYLVPGLLDLLKLRYTGCSLDSLYLTTNKVMAKQRLVETGIATPGWIDTVSPHVPETFAAGLWLIKPVAQDASVGIDEGSLIQAGSIDDVLDKLRLRESVCARPHYGEQFIDGREFTVCLYGTAQDPVILAPYEWVFEGFEERNLPKMFTYEAKWNDRCYAFDHILPRYHFDESDTPLLENLSETAIHCWHAFRLSGYARVDFRVDGSGKPWVLEANGNPSFYGFHHCAHEAGIAFPAIIERIVEVASKTSQR